MGEKINGNLLVVDDEPEVLRSIRRLFRKRYGVYTAGSAQEALDIAAQTPVNVILTDQRMPGTTGVELLEEIKRRHPLMVRLIITAYTDIDSVISAINEANIFRYIKKPWDPEKLTAAIEDAFRFHAELVSQNGFMGNFQERFRHMDVRIAEKTDKLLAANETLKAVYEERDALIKSLEAEIQTRKAMEARLRQIEKQEAIGTLVGGMAHDFNNLLYPIIGFTEMAMDDLPANSAARENLEETLIAAERAANLVRQILHFSHQRGNSFVPVDIASTIKDVLELIRAGKPRRIDIQTDIDPECGPVMADPSQLKQVMMNLCANAIQSMGESGGTLKISAGKAVFEPDAPPLHSLPADGCACITVADTGPGVDPAIMEKIFDPYFTTRSIEGNSGLGLAVALGIVRKTGGTIEAESRPGQGAAFHVYLPLKNEAGSEPKRPPFTPFYRYLPPSS